jgi:hypothetical protein
MHSPDLQANSVLDHQEGSCYCKHLVGIVIAVGKKLSYSTTRNRARQQITIVFCLGTDFKLLRNDNINNNVF